MLTRYCLLDLETVPADDCQQWLSPFEADKRLTDPQKIDADIARKRQAQLDEAGLDPDLCKIVCFGLWTWKDAAPSTMLAKTPDEERASLRLAWAHLSETCPMLGYGVSFFDAGVIVRRSQLLGVRVPEKFFRYGKYHHEWIVDLADRLTLNGRIEQKKGRGLEYHCQRLGVDVMDDISGKDIAALWAEGAHDAVLSHCLADLARIRALAERLHVIESAREAVA